MPLTTLTLNVAIALILGTLIGAERQWRQRMAGLRTNTLVCVGSALFVSVSLMTVDEISRRRWSRGSASSGLA
jgi:putative Mg2+ transporter-C (MgtC) family protein